MAVAESRLTSGHLTVRRLRGHRDPWSLVALPPAAGRLLSPRGVWPNAGVWPNVCGSAAFLPAPSLGVQPVLSVTLSSTRTPAPSCPQPRPVPHRSMSFHQPGCTSGPTPHSLGPR